ncbi:DUF6629 family protein [Streptomyces sp. GC420]|uniref:DUF6629 family protein n=1 Tax=Streptomyces sp. GC420 TaxID=2697568 RepID=UPI0014151AB3|nr:DUF6629 family protein [Streptomyces sp. GC420]NBM17395.1 hypothetical protein [Streptomyces sp. GC420]
MCWSATADLVAGACVSAAGVATVAQVRRARDLPLAALPLLLGAHQIIESAVWRDGGGPGPATLAWAVIALPLLPLWVPLGVLLAERDGTAPRLPRLPRQAVPAAAGAATTAVLAYCLATRTVTAEPRGRTIGYAVDVPQAPLIVAGYLLATIGALLLARDPLLRMLGVTVGAGAVVCGALWRTEFVSTWCAFAAVAALLVLAWVRRRAREARHDHPRYPAAGP